MVEFQLVDFATGKTIDGSEMQLDKRQRKRLFAESCSVISELQPVTPKKISRSKQKHLLVVLADKQPMSVLYFVVRADKEGRQVAWPHFKTRAGLTHSYFREMGETPIMSLLKWTKRIVGPNTALAVIEPLPPGKRFLKRLVKRGFLRKIGQRKGVESFSFASVQKSRSKRPKRR